MIRKINRIILTITLSLLIVLLVLNLTAKKAVEEVITNSWKSLIPELFKSDKKDDDSLLENIFNNEEISKFTEKIKEKTHYNETKESIEQEWSGMKDIIEEQFDNFIEEQEKKLTPKQQMTLKFVKFITQAKVKHYLIIGIIINLLLIIISTMSIFKWIKNLSYSLMLSGVSLIGICYWLKEFIHSIASNIEVNLHIITTPAIVLITVGIIIRAIYYIFAKINKINRKEKKEEKENEIS